MRKVIQVTVSGVENTINTQSNYIIVALCDDGSVWEKLGTHDWYRLEPIPQSVIPLPSSGEGGGDGRG